MKICRLPPGMDTCIGPPGTVYFNRLTCHFFKNLF